MSCLRDDQSVCSSGASTGVSLVVRFVMIPAFIVAIHAMAFGCGLGDGYTLAALESAAWRFKE